MIICEVEVLLHKKQVDDALIILSKIIDLLLKSNEHREDEQIKEYLTILCIKRIHINFKKQIFEDVLADVNILKELKYDTYTDTNVFLMNLEAETQISRNNMIEELENF
ncbi:unnamed protein product [Rotaria socialis]